MNEAARLIVRAFPAVLVLVLAFFFGCGLGSLLGSVLDDRESFSSARAAVSVVALLSLYATVSEKGFDGLRGMWRFIRKGKPRRAGAASIRLQCRPGCVPSGGLCIAILARYANGAV